MSIAPGARAGAVGASGTCGLLAPAFAHPQYGHKRKPGACRDRAFSEDEGAVEQVGVRVEESAYEPRSATETQLDNSGFIRIHRSYIVNVSRIRELQPCNSGEFIVSLRDGKELPCSRSYRRALQALYISR